MSAHIDSFLDYLRLERAYSPRTVQSYGMDLNEFEAYLRRTDAELTLETVDADNVRNWTMEMMEAGQKETSVNRRLSALRSFYRYLLRKEVVKVSPMQTVRGPKKKKPLPMFLREEEMNRLLDETDFGEGFEGERDRLIIEMFYETGMRRAELVGLNEADVDFYRGQIKVTGKRNKQRLIPFGEELGSALRVYLEEKAQEVPEAEDGALFVQKSGRRVTDAWVYTMVKRNLSRVTTIKKRSPHVLRHTFATTMLNHDAELEAVKELLGHESVSTTEIYTHTTFEELKNAYSKAHPRARK
ncbi:MAG: tyrosine recombinase XerC [Bacteroidaceae bacterium]|nr:tyrosine recombinase XerC [Bacteroidaceae bacterium]